MKHTIYVACTICDARGEVLSPELSRMVVCDHCLGQCYFHEDATAYAADLVDHSVSAPVDAAETPLPAA